MVRPRTLLSLGVATFIVVGAFFVAPDARAGTTGQISGTVRDGKTGEPIGLASVTIPDLKRGAVTDATGNYFILNLPPGKYTVRVALLGFVPQAREGVEVIPDFNAKLDWSLESTVLKDVAEVTVKAERPLIQKDVTGTTKFLEGDQIRNQPLRGYKDAVAQQSGVVNFQARLDNPQLNGNESLNGSTLIIRGGRPNEVAYYVDGFSQQDPLTGFSTTAINNDAVSEIVVQSGGFNAEYGRINSGVVNVVTREGSDKYFGSIEGVTDNLAGSWISAPRRDNNTYALSLGGPIVPSLKQVNFYLSGERRFNRDRNPSFETDKVAYAPQGEISTDFFEKGILPANSSASWATVGKLTIKPSPLHTLKIGGTLNDENWQQYLNSYRFDLRHAPRYEDKNRSVYGTWNQSLSDRAYYEVKANYFLTERMRGDGVAFDDLRGYSRPNGNPSYDQSEALFWYGDASATGPHVYDDFLHRKSSYVGFAANYANQLTRSFQLKAGGDYQRHTLRYYDHYFPTQLYDAAGNPDNTRDVDRYGYDALGNELNEGDTFTDTNGNGSYDVGEPFSDKNGNGLYDSPLDVPKHPKVASLYVQGKYERLGLVLNTGLRWDYLTPSTDALRSETLPLDPDATGTDSRLQATDLQKSKVYQRISPRLGVGFPVSDQTLLHVNYGKFFQQPNLQDLYVSYAFLEHKIRTGGYFVGFGNPNLKPEQTTAYELGIQHTPNDRSRVEASAYYKDVKDLVEITNIPSAPNAFSSYRNRDFATIKGLDLSYTLRRTGLVSFNASYSLSWARGTGSLSQTQRNIAWYAAETPKMSSPLAFDQRHKLSANFDFRYDKGQGPTWHGNHILENAGINLLANASSGTPYTPTKVYNEVTLANTASEPSGPVDARYGPWTFQVDAKMGKTIAIGRQNLELYIWALNIFNRDNVYTVYTSSGSAVTTNWLETAEGQAFIEGNASKYGTDGAIQRYQLAEQSPLLHGVPRMVRFGAKLNF
ncbi:MAG TPA: TonB-dependent receptor [Candidatus Eisenbacteria bacterium]|nr:TonB-dependent receptor [Candidatus Eisenbacteria bacterium]